MTEDLNYLQKKARDWALKVVELNNTIVPPALEGKKKALLSSAKTIKNNIEKVIGKTTYLQPLDQLGVIPLLIGAGAITVAIAAIVKWTTDYMKFKTEITEYKSLVNSGVNAQQASDIIFNKKNINWVTVAKIAIPTVLVAGAAILIFKRGNRK